MFLPPLQGEACLSNTDRIYSYELLIEKNYNMGAYPQEIRNEIFRQGRLLNDAVSQLCGINEGSGSSGTADNATPSLLSTTGSGSTTAGIRSFSITNVGGASGTVDGQTFPVGAMVSYEGYYDPVTNVFYDVDSIAYDATGTTFLISELT